MSSEIIVRQATPADAVELARLNALFNGGNTTPEEMAMLLSAAAAVETAYLAEMGGRAVAFACLRLIPTIFSAEPYAELTELYVEAAWRRQGVARALVTHLEGMARSAGATEFFLLTGFKNTNAHHFYHAIGYSLRCFAMVKAL
jgi:GNAT superfamily N-acetyltransferase